MASSVTPPTPDQAAAHEFLVDLRTRITTQPMPYQYGIEARALESLWEVFSQARAAMKKYPGCERFAALTTAELNLVIRPFTSKWHRAHADGRLASRDGADEFRGDLADAQKKLREFAEKLHVMAYGTSRQDDLSNPVMSPEELDRCFAPVKFGIPSGTRRLPQETIDAINRSESAEISTRRNNHAIATPEGLNAVGLGFSGGGIRSATFCLGVTQVLAERDLLKHVDYLSTVSGGGYTGSFLTVRLGNGAKSADVAGPHGPDPVPIRYVRHHAKFLNPANLRDGWGLVTDVFAGMLLNWTVPLLVVVLAALLALVAGQSLPAEYTPAWSTLLKCAGGATGLALAAYGGFLRGSKRLRLAGAWLLGGTSAITGLIAAAWLVEAGFTHYLDLREKLAGISHSTLKEWIALGVSGALAGAVLFTFEALPFFRKPLVRAIATKILLGVAGILIPLLALWLFYLCRRIGGTPGILTLPAWNPAHYGGLGLLVLVAGILAAVALFLLNINLTAPHRIYRDRLARTFIHTSRRDTDPVPLHTVNSTGTAPYHLINTALNLPSSELPSLRDRKCALFLFSKHWTGSATTGYHPTEKWRTNGEPVDLATAMATSGAAASSYMGTASMPTLSALLTFLNIRLGLWIRQPDQKSAFEAPGFACLLREMLGVGMNEKSRWLNLSDGGHIENLAVYELLRRRCKFIICVDAEADPAFQFQGLLTLVRYAQIDYGIEIAPDLGELRPNPETRNCPAHAMMCRIKYPGNGGLGLLLYLKLSVTGNEPELINRYRALHPEFPHQSTADQFFDEEQFEAYRQLGVHVAESLFSRALTNGMTRPASIEAWFRQLASNLMVP